jgi:hypothetical protein
MRFGTVLRLAGIGALALVIALVAVVKSIDVNNYRDVLVQAAKSATGRDLTIRGKFSFRLSLTPALIAEDVTLSNVAWGSRPEMIRLQQVRADIGLLPLLLREVRITRLQLVGPDILLERNAAGQGNWDVGPPPASALSLIEAAKTPLSFKVNQMIVGRGRVVYRDARSGQEKTLTIEQLTVDADTMASPVGLQANGAWNGQQFEISGVLGAMKGLLAADLPYPVKLKAVLPGLVATVNGTILADKGFVPRLSLQTTADATELAEAAKLMGFYLPPLGVARLSMTITGPLSSPSLTNIDAALGRRDIIAVTAKGSVKAPLVGEGVDLLLFAEGENLAGFNRSLDITFPAVGPIRGSAHLADFDGAWHLNEVKANIGHSDIVGELVLGGRYARPTVEAHFASAVLDLGELTGDSADVPKARTESAHIFSDDTLPFSLLGWADAHIVWKIDHLISGGLNAQQINLSVSAKGGKLLATSNVVNLAGGKANGSLTVDASTKVPSAVIAADAEKVGVGDLLKGFGVSRNVQGARTTLHMALKANGNSLRAMMARLSGDVSVVTDKGVLDQSSASEGPLDVLRQLAPWTQRKDTQMQCLVSRFSIVDGMAHSEALLFDSDAMTVIGQGSVNLGSELLDLTVAPRPKDAGFVGMASPLDIGGTLAHPTVTPNRGAIVKGISGVPNAVALGPLGLPPSVAGSSGDDGNACLAALNQVKKTPPARKASGKGS